MKIALLKAAVLLIASVLQTISHAAEPTLCSRDETMIASCHLNDAKNKIVSYCSSANAKTIVYRFGTRAKIELSTSFTAQAPMSRWVDLATYTVYLGFRRGKYSYIFGVPQETFGAIAFLDVERENKSVMALDCKNNSFGEKNLANEAIVEVTDITVRDNKFIFPPEGH